MNIKDIKEFMNKNKKIVITVAVTAVLGVSIVAIANKRDVPSAGQAVESQQTADVQSTPESKLIANAKTVDVVKNEDEVINNLIKTYFKASLEADMDTLATVVSDTSNMTREGLQRKYEYVEDIQNIDTYTLPGPDDHSKIVYVYYEMKIVDIDTVAPGMVQLYVSQGSDDNYVILLSHVEESILDYMSATLENPKVIELMDMVNKNLEQNMASDEKLNNFILKLEEAANNKETGETTETPAPEVTPEVAPVEEPTPETAPVDEAAPEVAPEAAPAE